MNQLSERTWFLIGAVSSGIILANLAVSSSSTVGDYALFTVDTTWLYAAAFICGCVLGVASDRLLDTVWGVGLMALIAASLFLSILLLGYQALLSDALFSFLDIILLSAIQQTVLNFIFISAIGCVGAFFSTLVKEFSS